MVLQLLLRAKDAQTSRDPCSGFLNTSIQKFISLCDGSLQPPNFYHVRAHLLSCAAQDLCHPSHDWLCFQRKVCPSPPHREKKTKPVIQVGIVPALTQRMIHRLCIPFWNRICFADLLWVQSWKCRCGKHAHMHIYMYIYTETT